MCTIPRQIPGIVHIFGWNPDIFPSENDAGDGLLKSRRPFLYCSAGIMLRHDIPFRTLSGHRSDYSFTNRPIHSIEPEIARR